MSTEHAHILNAEFFGKALVLGIALNVVFVIVEVWYGLKIDSLALLADAGHNLSDVAGLLVAWAALALGRKRPNSKHSYGWKKASVLAAFANSIFLLIAMGSLAWEAFGRFQAPVQTQGIVIMAVAGVGILINSLTAILFFKGSKRDINIRGAFLHMVADAAVSLGVVVSGAITLKYSYAWIDPLTSIAIALIIIWGTRKLLLQSLHLLFDGVPDRVNFDEVRLYLASLPGVKGVFDLHVWALSSSEIALSAHLHIQEVQNSDDFLRNISRQLHERFEIDHTTIQIMQAPLKNEYCN